MVHQDEKFSEIEVYLVWFLNLLPDLLELILNGHDMVVLCSLFSCKFRLQMQ